MPNEVFLLEILPGPKAQRLAQQIDDEAVNKYFKSITRSQLGDADQGQILRELLGHIYEWSFRYSLRYVDPSQLSPEKKFNRSV